MPRHWVSGSNFLKVISVSNGTIHVSPQQLPPKPGPEEVYSVYRTGYKYRFLILLIVFLGCLSFQTTISAQNTRYAIKSGSWNDPTLWSLTSGGATCNCIPDPNSEVHINETGAGYTVNMNVNGDTKDATIYSGGQLLWTDHVTLNFNNGGTFTIQNGGSTDGSLSLRTRIAFSAAFTYALIVNDAGTGLDIGEIWVEDNVTLNISGLGTISTGDDLEFRGNDAVVNNNFTGSFTIGDNLNFRGPGGLQNNSFINNETITLNDGIYFSGTDQ